MCTDQERCSRHLLVRRSHWSFAGRFFALVTILCFSLDARPKSSDEQSDNFQQPAARDWPTFGGDWSNTRYSSLTQINKQNVNQLGIAWISENFEESGRSRATPVVKAGVIYITAGRRVYAINGKTGTVLWRYKTVSDDPGAHAGALLEELSLLPNGAVPNPRGVAVGQELVFVGLQDGRVIALRARTGELVWNQQTGIDQPKVGQWASPAPVFADGLVFSGLSNGDAKLRGRLTALASGSGDIRWQFFAVPGPGEPGHETWPSYNNSWKFGGGGIWTNAAVDLESGTVYAVTGNATPPYAGDWRPGDNLYTSSIIAVDTKTGTLKWHYQLVHHDVYEADLGTPVILYDTQVRGGMRKAVAVLRGDGYLFQLDRDTGEPIVEVRELPIPQDAFQRTSPTQPFPIHADSVGMSCDDWRKEGIPSGFRLECVWAPPAAPPPSRNAQNVLMPYPAVKGSAMAYSPQTGYFYVQARSMLHWSRRSQDPYYLYVGFNIPGVRRKSFGELAAIDRRSGKIAWRKPIAAETASNGVMATAGGLIFRSSRDGNVEAYDAHSGDSLWRFQTGIAGALGPPVSYEIEGKQYVAVSMGPTLWAFKLGGRSSDAKAPIMPDEPTEFAGVPVATDTIRTTSFHLDDGGTGHYFVDEFQFNPYHARVLVGRKVLFANNGIMDHEIVARDGSWGTGPLSPGEEVWITFDKPGQFSYYCKQHPWTYGQVVAESASSKSSKAAEDVKEMSMSFIDAAKVGKQQFDKHCSTCHGADLSGRAPAPALSGSAFGLRWSGPMVSDLLQLIRRTMPPQSPGSLDQEKYLSIVAYILQANDLESSWPIIVTPSIGDARP